MILRNIRVQGFGCFADEIEVGPFTDGINLLMRRMAPARAR